LEVANGNFKRERENERQTHLAILEKELRILKQKEEKIEENLSSVSHL